MQIAANSVSLIRGGNVIKQGDETPFTFQLINENGEMVDLEESTVNIRLANNRIVILEKEATINDDNTVTFNISSDETTGHGEMRLEFVVEHGNGDTEIFPAQGYQEIRIEPSLGGLDSGYVATVTLEQFEKRIDEAVDKTNVAVQGANEAAENARQSIGQVDSAVEAANNAANNANSAGEYATTQGNYAKEQGDIARDESSSLSQLKQDVTNATESANESAGNADQAADNAEQAANEASTQAEYATTQGDYAKEQGDYAKLQGERAQDIADGTGILTQSDVGEVVAGFNEDGQVLDANGNVVEGKVKSVNNVTPDENGNINVDTFSGNYEDLANKPNIPSRTSELENDSNFATQQDLENIEIDTSDFVSQQDFTAHQANNTAHGIGDKSQLLTTNKTTIVSALNELFTNVSNGKSLIGGAITDVDDNVVIPTEPTFNDLANAIGQISTGKKYLIGTVNRVSSNQLVITGLEFNPSIVIADGSTSGALYSIVYIPAINPSRSFTYASGLYSGLTGVYDDINKTLTLSGALFVNTTYTFWAVE